MIKHRLPDSMLVEKNNKMTLLIDIAGKTIESTVLPLVAIKEREWVAGVGRDAWLTRAIDHRKNPRRSPCRLHASCRHILSHCRKNLISSWRKRQRRPWTKCHDDSCMHGFRQVVAGGSGALDASRGHGLCDVPTVGRGDRWISCVPT